MARSQLLLGPTARPLARDRDLSVGVRQRGARLGYSAIFALPVPLRARGSLQESPPPHGGYSTMWPFMQRTLSDRLAVERQPRRDTTPNSCSPKQPPSLSGRPDGRRLSPPSCSAPRGPLSGLGQLGGEIAEARAAIRWQHRGTFARRRRSAGPQQTAVSCWT